MSIGANGIGANAAGLPLVQTTGAATERAQQAIAARARRAYHEQKAEAAAGVGELDGEHHQPGDRDADGRRPWEEPSQSPIPAGASLAPRQSKDPSRQSGNLLDLTG